jgi:hypothetical protein
MFLLRKKHEEIVQQKRFLSFENVKAYVRENPCWEIYKCFRVFQGWIEKKGELNKTINFNKLIDSIICLLHII